MAEAEIIVVGGGPAGAAAACLLAQAGRRVLLLERETGPHHKVCGEFVSTEAASLLRRLGIDLAALGAEPVESVRLIAGERQAEAWLPFPAFGLSRRALDEALLARASALGAEIRRGTIVRGIEPAAPGRDGRTVRLGGGAVLCARHAIFLATGKHDLKGWARPEPKAGNGLIGFKMHFRPGAGGAVLGNGVELHLFDGFYAGLQRVEGGLANLCLLLPSGLYARLGRNWEDVLAYLMQSSPTLGARLKGAEPVWDRPLAIARVPYGYVHQPAEGPEAGVWRLGDQAAVTPSFTGDGLAIALHTGSRAARIFLAGGEPAAYHAELRRGVGAQVVRSTLLARALLSPPLQPALIGVARIWPGLLRAGARLTRLPDAVLRLAA